MRPMSSAWYDARKSFTVMTWTPLPAIAFRYAGRVRDQGLALTGLHLGDVAEVERGAAHDLHVVGALAERALGRFADRGERLGHELVERLAGLVAGAQLGGLAAQLFVGQLRVVLFEGVDGLHDLLKPPEDSSLAGAKQFLERVGHGAISICQVRRESAPVPPGAKRTGIPGHVTRP